MLQPFQIRDLHVYPAEENLYDSSTDSVISSPRVDDTRPRRHGIITLSAPEYDEIASNHPNAMLTYLDDDEGDIITVGSSFELRQRLDEPVDYVESILNDSHPMHLFDIRRSKSVTELWKAFERRSAPRTLSSDESSTITMDINRNEQPEILKSRCSFDSENPWNATDSTPKASDSNTQDDETPANASSHQEPQRGLANESGFTAPSFHSQAEPEPFLSAFEAEMAKMLEEKAAKPVEEQAHPSSSTEANTFQSDSTRPMWPGDLVANVLQSVVGGMESLGTELRAKLPEIERRLADAQKNIPDDINAKARTALTAVESQIKNLAQIIQNASDASGQAAERVRQAELRSAEQIIDGLGGIAQGFEDFGKTLFAAFEAEFGQRDTSTQTEARTNTTPYENHEQSTAVESQTPESSNTAKFSSEANATEDLQQQVPGTGTSAGSGGGPQRSLNPYATTTSQIPSNPIPIVQSTAPIFTPRHYHVPEVAHFANWPNRSAFVPSPPRANPSPVVSDHASRQQSQLPSTSPNNPANGVGVPATIQSHVRRLGATTDSLFIGNVGYQVNERVIEEVFASRGLSAQVQLPKDSFSGRHAGFGYARFQSAQFAKAALEKLQGIIIDGHSINLEYCDNSPIDTLQTRPFATERAAVSASSNFTTSQRLRHRQSWHPSTRRSREQHSVKTSSQDDLPKIFSGNSRGGSLRSRTRDLDRPRSLVERNTSPNHPEESPEFAARYPSLLPSRDIDELPPSVPKRSMTFSPNTEMARFPPVSQLDAHLLANRYRSQNRNNNEQLQPSLPAMPSLSTTDHREPAVQPDAQPIQESQDASSSDTIREASRGTDMDIRPLRLRRTRESTQATQRPSLQGTLPGSFPVDNDTERATHENNENSDQDMQTAMRQSVIDNCVDNLAMLGYETGLDGGRYRLHIYAEAAEGKLSEAIDMIEEERQAYERYRS